MRSVKHFLIAGVAGLFAGITLAMAQSGPGLLNLPPLPDLGVPPFMLPQETGGEAVAAGARCDQFAATDDDRGAALKGVEIGQLDAAAAIRACEAAVAEGGGAVGRHSFQLARALRVAGDLGRARQALEMAAARGHVPAQVELSWMMQRGEGGPRDLASAFRLAELAGATGHPAGLYRFAGFFRHPLVGRMDLERWRDLLELAAAGGSAAALSDLAMAYETGEGVTQNADIAADLYLSLVEAEGPRAQRGSAEAIRHLALAAERGVGAVARDPAIAVKRYLEAEALGDPVAAYALGRLKSEGRNLPRNRVEACDHFERGARWGHLPSLTALGTCFLRGDGRALDEAHGERLLAQAHASGDDFAPMLLGQRLERRGSDSRGQTRELLRVSAERGNSDGMVAYGVHLSADGVARAKEACDWFELAAGLGHGRAMANLGGCFASGNGGRNADLALALEWFGRGADRGDGLALRHLGEAHLNGIGTPANPDKAFVLLRRGAEAGDAGAMNSYGMMLTQGIAGATDVRAGCDWFEKAANAGMPRAMSNLGACLANGEGREVNLDQGRQWYEKAVAAGDVVAMTNLGDLYMSGRGVDRDPERAAKLFATAAGLGHAPAAVELAAALFNGVGVARDPRAACRWYERAAASSDPAGWNGLGVCAESGIGRRRDVHAALALFERAALAGSTTALRNLIRIHDRGLGVTRNPDAAAYWMRRAIDVGYDGLINDFLSYPSSWSRDMRRALQRNLKRDGLYSGAIDGLASASLDHVIWSLAKPNSKKARLTQSFTYAPMAGTPRGLLVRVCKPPHTSGRRPLAVINHGLTTDDNERRDMRPLSCGAIASFFTDRGYYVAIPLRRGYGETGGAFIEGGTQICATSPTFVEPGLAIAADIQATIRHMTKLPEVRPDGTLVIGHSGGAWGALALASMRPEGLAGFVNISGIHGSNRGVPDGVCGTEPIVRSTREFGRTARAPTLWIYAENDSHASPSLVRRMHDTYLRGGGRAELRLLPASEGDGHNIFDDDSLELWGGYVDGWLKSLDGVAGKRK